MAVTSPDEIWTPDTGDNYALTTDLAAMADTIQDALTNLRNRAGYRADLTNAQRLALTGGDLFEGLRVRTTDTKTDWLYTGGVWVAWGVTTVNISSFGTGWTAVSGHTPRVVREGNRVSLFGAVSVSGSGAFSSILTVPTGYAPSVNTFLASTHSNQTMNGVGLIAPSGLFTIPAGYFDGSLSSGGILPLVGSWYI